MPITSSKKLCAYLPAALLLAAATLAFAFPANAGVIYNLDATNVQFSIPSSLFTGTTVTGFIEIADGAAVPNGSFGTSDVQALSFNVAGYHYTLMDFLSGYDFDGRISADGQSIPFLSSGYDLNTNVPGCGGGCFGSLDIAQSQPSNLFVVSDANFSNYGLVEFDTAFTRAAAAPVPEPLTLSLFGAGFAGVVAIRRRRKMKQA
jgi:hypothetical protein